MHTNVLKLDTAAREYVYKVVRKLVFNVMEHEDLVQETLFRAHKYADTFKGDGLITTWLYVITKQVIHDFDIYRRRAKRNAPTVELKDSYTYEVNPTAGLELQEIFKRVELLTPALQQAFWQYASGMTEGEVASANNLTVSAARARIHRARLFVLTDPPACG